MRAPDGTLGRHRLATAYSDQRSEERFDTHVFCTRE
jgi:hypothetical protein